MQPEPMVVVAAGRHGRNSGGRTSCGRLDALPPEKDATLIGSSHEQIMYRDEWAAA